MVHLDRHVVFCYASELTARDTHRHCVRLMDLQLNSVGHLDPI